MINVLHLRDTDRICGPGKTIIETAVAAEGSEFHHSIGLLMRDDEKENAYLDAARRRGVEVVPVRTRHQYHPQMLLSLLKVIRERDIHIIHSHEYKSDLLAWAVRKIRPIPVISTVHGWIRNSTKGRLFIKMSQMALPSFDRVIAVSTQTKDAIISAGVPATKVDVIHNGIVVDNYRADRHERGFIRRQFSIPETATIVGYVGRLSPEKGQRDLLAAAARLVPRYPDLWIALIGDGPDRQSLAARAEELGIAQRVVFTGHLHDVRPAHRDLDFLALTSHTEGFPNVVLEAFCMGTPVLATNVGGVSEIVHDGRTGVLIRPHAPDEIEAGLTRLLDQPQWARQLAANGRSLVLERFTFQERVEKEHAVCRQVLAS